MIGKTLAHYEITELLGKGGMGEVYRARDTRLGREVAIKVLPPELSGDPERAARMDREARTLASLQHPNIASIYGLEEADGIRFLAMELVEGEDLAHRLTQGPLSVDEAVRVARQMVAGLEAAHEKSIVHRDLKPANVKIAPDGVVKILDFGLARAYGGEAADAEALEHSPTITAAMTRAGVILGTAGYMSPEQARGRGVDKRSDIWSFGVVLWELLTGRQLFSGETVSDTLAAVLTREVDAVDLPSDVPVSVRHLLARCLERDPRRRLRDIGEARVLLEEPETISSLGGVVVPARTEGGAPARRGAVLLPWLLLLAVLGVGLPLVLLRGGGEPERRVRRFAIDADLPRIYNTRAVEISPDGRSIAIYARDGLWVRELDDPAMRLLIGPDELVHTEGGITPFWSPDSQYIAYGMQGRLWKVPVDGGNPAVVCALPGGWNGGAWGADGTIVFCTSRGPMYSVPARGGDATLLVPLQEGEELDFHQPAYVTDGGGFVYSVHRAQGVDTIELWRGGERTVLLRIEGLARDNVQVLNNPVYSTTGHILFQRDQGNRGLWALPFDGPSGEVTGDPFLIASEHGHPSVSEDGTLIYMRLENAVSGQLVAVARDGTLRETLTDPAPGTNQPTLSPAGDRVAYTSMGNQSSDILVLDRGTGITSRLRLSPDHETDPTWIPGGDRIGYAAPFENCMAIWATNADGTGEPELLLPKGVQPTFGPDGRELVCTTRCSKDRGLQRITLGEGNDATLLRQHPAGIDAPALSPDGRLLAYRTWESGEVALEVADFPSMTGRRLVARSESSLRWSRDGRQIYYVSADPPTMMAASLEAGDVFKIEGTQALFALGPLGVNPYADFDVSADGSEFILVRSTAEVDENRRFMLVENWFEEFREE